MENKQIVEAPEGEGQPQTIATPGGNSSAPPLKTVSDEVNVGVTKAVNV